jgi:ATP-dependent RNA helicase RhlE
MIQFLMEQRGIGLILVPTRELAMQVETTLNQLGRPFGVKSVLIIGGASIHNQIADLRRRPRVIVATPGRLIDHIDQHTVLLFDAKFLVLDEADRMFDMGFAPQIKRILQVVPAQRQTLMFSATMPPEIIKIATQYMKLPMNVEIAPQGATADNVTQELFIVRKVDKKDLVLELLRQYTGTVLIFTRTKFGAKALTRQLRDQRHQAAEIHSNRSLAQRKEALEGFKSGRYRILIATDIAARGIDVTGIELVLNYDLPDETENYVHRIGRTARAGKAGHAISIATPEQGLNVRRIERLIRNEITVSKHPEILAATFDYEQQEEHHYSRRQPSGRPPARPGRRFSR